MRKIYVAILAVLLAGLVSPVGIASDAPNQAEATYIAVGAAPGVALSWSPCPYFAPHDPDRNGTEDYCLQGRDDPTGWDTSDPIDDSDEDPLNWWVNGDNEGGALFTGSEDDVRMSGGTLHPDPLAEEEAYVFRSVLVTADDAVINPQQVAISVCFMDPTGDNVCDDDDGGTDGGPTDDGDRDVGSGIVCGPNLHSVPPEDARTWSNATAFMWTYAILLDVDGGTINVCGSSTGTMSALYS